jgi:hypothetical protein
MLSAFGDTDDDGDIDMVSTVKMFAGYNNATLHLILYENTAGNVTGTPPIWVEKETIDDLSSLLSLSQGSLSLVDLNHDNKLDIVFAKTNARTSYYNNTGEADRAEWIKVDETTSESPYAEMIQFSNIDSNVGSWYPNLIYADMDDDGDLDIISFSLSLPSYKIIAHYIENIAVHNAAPIFQQNGDEIIAGLSSAGALTVGDLDNDGDLDLLIGQSDYVRVLENTGSGKQPAWTLRDEAWMSFDTRGFASSQSASTPDFKNTVFFQQMIDIDLDGMLEFVYATTYKMKFFRSIKTSGPTHFVQKFEWAFQDKNDGFIFSLAVSDLNGDGNEDLVLGTKFSGVYYYLYEQIGTNGVEYSERKRLTDKNGNAMNTVSTINIHGYLNPLATNSVPTFMDVDLNGISDVLLGAYVSAVSSSIQLYKNSAVSPSDPLKLKQGSSSLSSACSGLNCWSTTGHFDNDNILDLMIGDWKEIVIYKHNSDATFSRQTEWETDNGLPQIISHRGGVYHQITFGDVDKDGDDDAVVGTYLGTLEYFERIQLVPPKWIQRDGTHGWSLATINVGTGAKPILIDYDTDGDLDLIVANSDGDFFLFEQGTCASDCTTSGSCNIGTQYMPTCSCTFQGATDGKSCNSW